MSDSSTNRSSRSRFSLQQLLILTTLIALGVAVGISYRANRLLTDQRDELLALSSRLPLDGENELISVPMQAVADDFLSWQVRIPATQDYELRLGIGSVSANGIPPVVGSVLLSAGQHRVTLYTGDSVDEEYRYAVYVDGQIAIEKTMGKQWLPGGWSGASSISWPHSSRVLPPPLQLAAQSYSPQLEFTKQEFFYAQNDEYVTKHGYRLWIDQPNGTYPPESPFVGPPDHTSVITGFGLCDGLRYVLSPFASLAPQQLTFTRPKLGTTEPMLRVEAEFVTFDGALLSCQNQSITSWQIRNPVGEKESQGLQDEALKDTRTLLLQASSVSTDAPKPVVELKWEVNKPDAVGIRLADTSANASVRRWRLRILGGGEHLWRELKLGDRPWITPNEALSSNDIGDQGSVEKSSRTAILDLSHESGDEFQLQWQTTEALPLQIVARKANRYAGMRLYKGLPVKFGIQLPAAMKPNLAVEVLDQDLWDPKSTFPGGAVYEAIQLEVEGTNHDWIWLSAEKKE